MSNKKSQDGKFAAFVTTFLSLIGFIIALLAWRDDKYVMFYAKQSLGVFICALISKVADLMPVIGEFVSGVIGVIVIILWVLSWVYALSGEKRMLPVVGEYFDKIKL